MAQTKKFPEWTSCKEELPPKGVLLEVIREGEDTIRRVYIKGWWRKRWVYKSGMRYWHVTDEDSWRPVIK